MVSKYHNLMTQVVHIARLAGQELVHLARQPHLVVAQKSDQSAVTQADLRSHTLISQGLQTLTPEIPIVSEEGALLDWDKRRRFDCYWLIDPLDGTQEFIHGTDEFTINIALIVAHQVALGVVHVPMFAQTYTAMRGDPAYLQQEDVKPQAIRCQAVQDPIRVIVSRRLDMTEIATLQALLAPLGACEVRYCGSALKICLIAAGKADLYVRLGTTAEWDTAAAQGVLQAAGGAIVDLQGQDLSYNTQASIYNPSFVAMGQPAHFAQWLSTLKA